MSIGPLRRLVGTVGLLGLVPLLAMLAIGLLSPEDAAFRALVMLAGLMALGRFVSWGVGALAAEVEQSDPAPSPADTPEHHPTS